ncbi:lysis system i-spanin subunit Rz [Caballeronia sp. dw_19]|uniref:lysis system i-spanin subunit Rz n=1 Tax=Caballeronia sp. dw_19 TaxID=2719791 RepID=UPI001BD4C8AB|nr:lysis system i-spanin subunit Rz [Caballeronia sp. dw_19]
MNGYFITGIAAALLGAAIGAGTVHKLDGVALAQERGAHAKDNATHANEIAQINADSAKALSAALAKQQAAEGQVASIETQFNTEVANHAKDSLDYRAQLIAGTQRVRVRVASCGPATAGSESAATTGSADAATSVGYLDGQTASSVFKVAADDQAEIDKLSALQAYVKSLQDQGFIGK